MLSLKYCALSLLRARARGVVSTDSTAELLVSLLRAPSWDAERWGRARAAALAGLRGQRVGFRSIGWSVERWRLRGWKDDPRPLLVEQLEAAGAEDLQGLMRSLAAAPMTLTIVGDLQGLDREALRALGELQELELSQLTT